MTQIKTLYANGDSFVFGMEAIADSSRDLENKNFSFPKHIAEAYNLQYLNNAYNSSTNEFIFRRTIFDLEKLLDVSNAEEIFVLIGWTSLYREEIAAKQMFEFFIAENNHISVDPNDQEYHNFGTFFINPNQSHDISLRKNDYVKQFNMSAQIRDFCAMYLWDDQLQTAKLTALMIALHNYLKIKGFKHLFVNCCNSITEPVTFPIDACVIHNWEESFYSWGRKKYPNLIREKNHFHHKVHKEYADILLKYINEKKLIP